AALGDAELPGLTVPAHDVSGRDVGGAAGAGSDTGSADQARPQAACRRSVDDGIAGGDCGGLEDRRAERGNRSAGPRLCACVVAVREATLVTMGGVVRIALAFVVALSAIGQAQSADTSLDYEYFKTKVQ